MISPSKQQELQRSPVKKKDAQKFKGCFFFFLNLIVQWYLWVFLANVDRLFNPLKFPNAYSKAKKAANKAGIDSKHNSKRK